MVPDRPSGVKRRRFGAGPRHVAAWSCQHRDGARAGRRGFDALAGLGNARSAVGDHEFAARLHGAADALLEQLGIPMHPDDAAAADRWKTVVQEALGERRRGRSGRRLLEDPFELELVVGSG